MAQERLNKFIARAGIASRRKADELIQKGKVRVNGQVVTNLGIQVDSTKDKVEYQGKILQPATPLLFMFNKPSGVTSTMADVHATCTIADYFKEVGRVYPVGRLDKDSEGLMLATNDGDLANQLTHPRYEHEKEYEVVISDYVCHSGEPLGRLQNRIINNLYDPGQARMTKKGMLRQFRQDDGRETGHDDLMKKFSGIFMLDGYKTRPMQVKAVKKINSQQWLITLILKEGRKRQIRRIAEVLGYQVKNLKRIRIGKLKLGDLPQGKYRRVSVEEII